MALDVSVNNSSSADASNDRLSNNTKNNSYRVLIIRFSSFGDILQTLDLQRIFEHHPNYEVHYLTKASFKDILLYLWPELTVHTISNKAKLSELYGMSKTLQNQSYDIVLDLHNNLRSRVLCILLGRVTLRISKKRLQEAALFLLRGAARCLGIKIPHRSKQALALVAPGLAHNLYLNWKPSYTNSHDLIQKQININHSKPYVCITSESAWVEKTWPHERFVTVASYLISEGYNVCWLGVDRSNPIPALVGIQDMRGQLSMDQLPIVLQKSHLLISNDTGLMHMAEMVGTPVVAIFGPTEPSLGFGPRSKKSAVAQASLWCRPCSKNGKRCHRWAKRRLCLEMVTVEQVLELAHDTLQLKKSQADQRVTDL
jgi:heptosyltransferase-2